MKLFVKLELFAPPKLVKNNTTESVKSLNLRHHIFLFLNENLKVFI